MQLFLWNSIITTHIEVDHKVFTIQLYLDVHIITIPEVIKTPIVLQFSGTGINVFMIMTTLLSQRLKGVARKTKKSDFSNMYTT